MNEIQEGFAKLNVTFSGFNGELPDPVPYDADDATLRRMAEESIRGGYIPGIQADPNADLTDFVVDRFPATADVNYNRIFVRPKVPFGSM